MRNPDALEKEQSRREGTGIQVASLKTNVSGCPILPKISSACVKLYQGQTSIHSSVADHSPFYQYNKLEMRRQTRKEANDY